MITSGRRWIAADQLIVAGNGIVEHFIRVESGVDKLLAAAWIHQVHRVGRARPIEYRMLPPGRGSRTSSHKIAAKSAIMALRLG